MRNLQAVTRLVARRLGTSARSRATTMKQPFDPAGSRGLVPNNATYQRLQQLQSEWAKDAHNLVWQKKGSDKPLYFCSLLFMVGGIGYTVYTLFLMGFFPIKK